MKYVSVDPKAYRKLGFFLFALIAIDVEALRFTDPEHCKVSIDSSKLTSTSSGICAMSGYGCYDWDWDREMLFCEDQRNAPLLY